MNMIKTIVSVEGMACGMCEAHINDAIRAAFPVKKVTSSHTRKETFILSNDHLDPDAVKQVIKGAGYTPLSVTEEAFEKKGLFHWSKA